MFSRGATRGGVQPKVAASSRSDSSNRSWSPTNAIASRLRIARSQSASSVNLAVNSGRASSRWRE